MFLLHPDDETDILVSVIIIIVFDPRRAFLSFDDIDDPVFEILRPHANRKLSDFDFVITCFFDDAADFVLVQAYR